MQTDVLVVGGGPAGLAAAIAAAEKGLQVAVVDPHKPPIDKACGEGLLPEAVAALRTLGIQVERAPGFRFAGIQFADEESSAAARFPEGRAYGVRRTALHQMLVDRASALGVALLWGKQVTSHDSLHARAGGDKLFFRWLVAADGLHSPIRRKAGLNSVWRSVGPQGRFAFRRHYAVAPWSDLVEVYWGEDYQAIVTPTGREEVCVAVFASDRRMRIESTLTRFPELAKRLVGATPSSAEAGSRTMLAQARAVVHGNIALIGDAACSIDGVAGQGLNLAFQSAIHLGEALAREDLRGYTAAHYKVTRMATRMTQLLLLMASSNWVRRKALRMFASDPDFFSKMISIHAGAAQPDAFRLAELFDLGWEVLRA